MSIPDNNPTPLWDVVVIGAGPVGLATAIELSRRGIRCLLVERNERVGVAPRAKTCNVRTCEHLRRWGIVDQLRARAPFGIDYPSNIVFATRLAGKPLARFENAFYCKPGRHASYAEHAQWIPQYKLEETLLAHVNTLPDAQLRFNAEATELEQNEHSVTLTLKTAKGIEHVRSRYVVAADGAGSHIRAALDIRMSGVGALSKHRMMIFRSPELEHRHALGPAVAYWLLNGDTPSAMGPMDDGGRWYFGFTPREGEDGDALAAFRRACALDIEPEVLSVGDWTAWQLVADRYRNGRVFLAGDACHLHPPYGGYGMNLGIGDAVDIGWKLAAALQGWGGEALLDSYETERRPVHLRTIEEAVFNHTNSSGALALDGIEDEGPGGDEVRRKAGERICATKQREFDTLGVVIGYHYENSPVVIDEGHAPTAHYRDYVPSAAPGARAPHLWLTDGESTAHGNALYDHFGDGFTLLITSGDETAAAPLLAAAQARHIPLTALAIDNAGLRDLYEQRFVLIRPDQHVAWRGDRIVDDVDALLTIVTGTYSQ